MVWCSKCGCAIRFNQRKASDPKPDDGMLPDGSGWHHADFRDCQLSKKRKDIGFISSSMRYGRMRWGHEKWGNQK